MHTIMLALSFQIFFPIFEKPEPGFVTVNLINTSWGDAEFAVSLKSPQGGNTITVDVAIPKGEERLVAISQLVRPGVKLEGWIEVEASTNDFSAYLVTGNGLALGAVDPVRELSSTVYLPDVSVRGEAANRAHADTEVTVVNPGSEEVTVAARVVGFDGGERNVVYLQIPARGRNTFQVSDVLPGSGAPGGVEFHGWIMLQSNKPVAAWQRVITQNSWSSMRGKSPSEFQFAPALFAPYFAIGGHYSSTLNLMNRSSETVTVSVSGHDAGGSPVGETVQVTLQPRSAFSSGIADLLRVVSIATYPAPLITGYLRIRDSAGGPVRLVGSVEIQGLDAERRPESGLQYWLQHRTTQMWEIPFVTTSAQYFTAYAIANPNDWLEVQADVNVDLYAGNGQLLQRTKFAVSPGAMKAAMLAQDPRAAYIRISSNLPVVVLGTMGTRDGRTIEAIMPRQ